MTVDSFKFLPRIIARFYQMTDRQPMLPIPWTPISGPLAECTFGLITSGGLYRQSDDVPFDMGQEKEEPCWGDPSWRVLPADTTSADIGVSHLHINPAGVLDDINILLPLDRFKELATAGRIGGLGPRAFSFMGYQGFPPDATAWQETYGPQVAHEFKSDGVSCVLLTPT